VIADCVSSFLEELSVSIYILKSMGRELLEDFTHAVARIQRKRRKYWCPSSGNRNCYEEVRPKAVFPRTVTLKIETRISSETSASQKNYAFAPHPHKISLLTMLII
jgi:hypothetical protein